MCQIYLLGLKDKKKGAFPEGNAPVMHRLWVSVLTDDSLPDSEQSIANLATNQLPHLTDQITEVPERRRNLLGLVVEGRPDLALPDETMQLTQIRKILGSNLHVIVNISSASDNLQFSFGSSQTVVPDTPAGHEAVAEVVVVAGLGHEGLKSGRDPREDVAGVEGDLAGIVVFDLNTFEDQHLLLMPAVATSSPFLEGRRTSINQSVSIQVNL